MAAVRNGELLTVPDDGYDPNADMAAHSSAHKKASTSKDTYLSKEDLQELRRVQAERTQVWLSCVTRQCFYLLFIMMHRLLR